MDAMWAEFLRESEWGVRLLLAAALGGVLGWERERKDLPAGLRTYILVALGSCLFTLLSVAAFPLSEDSRVAAQIVVGIGFLGAGTVLRVGGDESRQVKGLTTAAGMWVAAAIGMAVGTGYYWLAVISTIIAYVTLSQLKRFEALARGGKSPGDSNRNGSGQPPAAPG